MNLVQWKEIIESDSKGRYKILEESLNISPTEAKEAFADPVIAGILVYEKALDMGLEKYQALGEIKTHTVAALVEQEWDRNSSRKLSRRLQERYAKFRLNGEPYIHHLRSEVFRQVEGKRLNPNFTNGDWDVEYSRHDLVRGTKIPPLIDEQSSFLCGVYTSIGHLNGTHQFYLSSSKKRHEFIDTVVSHLVKDIFNLEFEMNKSAVTKSSGFNNKYYSFNTFDPTITSKAHAQFLDKYFYDPDNAPRAIVDDEVCTSEVDKRLLGYFAGLVNSRGTLSRENNSLILNIMSKNRRNFLQNTAELGGELGFNSTLRDKNNTNMLRYSKKELEKMTQTHMPFYESRPEIFSSYQGIFCNPYQLRQLEEL
ncbi:MAG: hypothetical protein ACOCQX_02705 [Candidatus Nanoarchaeia archaeon]